MRYIYKTRMWANAQPGTLEQNPGAMPPIFLVWVRTVALHLYSRFRSHRFRFVEVITEKLVHEAPK